MNTELAHYSTATQLAETFQDATAKMRAAIIVIGEQSARLSEAFFSSYRFDVDVHCAGDKYKASAEAADQIIDEMQRSAWGVLLDKLEIRKLMNSKRQEEMSDALRHKGRCSRLQSDNRLEMPPITPESIIQVLQGMISSAGEFLEESIREEFDWLRPREYRDDNYKRNHVDRVGLKVIRGWACERGYGSRWRPTHSAQPHLVALDNIFHALDGKGVMGQHYGPLVSAIQTCGEDGRGETEYFRFKCHKNGNIHLEFLRKDLLDEFNTRASGAALGKRDRQSQPQQDGSSTVSVLRVG